METVTINKLYALLQDMNHRMENIERHVCENARAEEIMDEIEIYNNPKIMAAIKETVRKCDEDIKHGRVYDIDELIDA